MPHRRRTPIIVLAAVVSSVPLLILAGGCGGGSDRRQSGSGCRTVPEAEPRVANLDLPQRTVRRGEMLSATVKTNCGTFEIALDTRRAPLTTSSFAYLTRHGFYDGLAFDRISPGYVIQGGDPSGTGTGGPGYSVDEPPPPNLAYTRGVVAMAKTSAEPPGRSGSQFFIVTGADAGLSPEYALLGRVRRGFDVVERIGRLGNARGQPKQTVLTEKVTIEKGEG